MYKYICQVSNSFSKEFTLHKKSHLAIIVPQLRKDGMYYEVNIKNYPRFYMSWSALGRFDITGDEVASIPYEVVLAVSDIIEKMRRK